MSIAPRLRMGLLAALFLAQLGAATAGIVTHERTLRSATAVRLAVVPVDPADPFRGRYVQLRFGIEQQDAVLSGSLAPTRAAYAILDQDASGLAHVKFVSQQRPRSGVYLSVRAWSSAPGRARIEVPFDRYYMHEELAPRAEAAYRERVGGRDSYASVRVRDGHAVIEAVYVGGRSIEQAALASD
jgi:uncharacterized membrane-anchored protein